MAGEAALGRAVLAPSTYGKSLGTGLADVPKKVQKVGEAVKGLGGSLGQVNGLLETFGVGLSIGAVVAFGKSVLDLADNIVKVSDRTGLATDDVQRLQFIAEQSGNSIDDLAGSISKLQVRLADGKAKAGIEALGLNFKKIREESPYDALSDVAEAIGKIENPTLRAQRAVEVFGKAGTEILPTLVANFKQLGQEAPVMSDEDKKALKEQAEALDDIRRAAIPLTDAQKAAAVANEKLGISAGTTAKAFKISEAAVSTYLEGIKNAAEIEKMWAETRAKWAEETSKLSRKAADDFKKDQQQIADASAKVITERLRQTIDFETRNADAKRKGADLAIAQIERERDATIAALDAESEMRGPLYERDLAAIKKFYQNQIDLAKGTASTIEQRMRAQGVATREDLALSADAATRDYEQMRASGLYSTEEIQAAFVRMQDAIERSRGSVVNWGATLGQVAQILGSAFGSSGAMGPATPGLGAISKSIDAAAASTKQWGNSAGVAAPLFSDTPTKAQKAAAAVASGATIAAGAMDVWAATSEKTGKAVGALHGAVSGAKAGAAFGPYGGAIGAG